jgi:protein SCO1/2
MNLQILRRVLWGFVVLVAALLVYMLFFFEAGKTGTGSSIVQQELGAKFQLTNNKGEAVTDTDVKATPHAIFFGFTHCPEVCPTTLFESTGWLKALGDDADKLKFYFITIDPARDTREQLSNYLQAFDPRITALTGDQAEIDKVIKGYRVYVRKIPNSDGEDDNYNMDHTASIFLFNRGGSFQGTIAYREDPDVALKKLQKLIAKNN